MGRLADLDVSNLADKAGAHDEATIMGAECSV